MSTTTQADLLAAARDILPDIVAVRRTLHRIPEVGLQIPRTQAVVADAVRTLGLEPRLGSTTSSVVAVIKGGRPGPTVLLRADMDALPLTEDTGLDFASETPGRMHACGHDTHVAMLLGAARLLLAHQAELTGDVLLMFQPGEEGWHGARFMLEEGLLDVTGQKPAGAFALHISTDFPTGEFHYRPGPLLAAGDRFEITLTGRGGHASAPHNALDPITVAAELVIALNLMVTRRVDAFDPAVLTVARITSGTTSNIIPETAVLEGTMRTVSAAQRAGMRARLDQVVAGICAAHGVKGSILLDAGFPVTVCDPGFVALAREEAIAVAGKDAVVEMKAPIMGAEDFSYVLEQVPGAMFFIGARPAEEDPATAPPNHSNRVIFDEAPMALGAATYAAVALRVLAGTPAA